MLCPMCSLCADFSAAACKLRGDSPSWAIRRSKDCAYLFLFYDVWDADSLVTVLTYLLQGHICECFNFSCFSLKTKHEREQREVCTWHQFFATKSRRANWHYEFRSWNTQFGCQSPPSRLQTCVTKFDPAIYAEHRCLSGGVERSLH